MGKWIIFLAICGRIWYAQNNYDFSSWKQNALNVMSQEKTVQTVNTSRQNTQNDINDVNNR